MPSAGGLLPSGSEAEAMTGVGEAGPRGEARARTAGCAWRSAPAAASISASARRSRRCDGATVRRTCRAVLDALRVRHAVVSVEDQGALDFVPAARLEAAVKRARALRGAFLPPSGPGATRACRDRLRRSRLYLPGGEPRHFVNARLHAPDAVILDLEDAVAPSEKDAARLPGPERPPGCRLPPVRANGPASTRRPRPRGRGRRGAA